jgi:Xaa-Pro aminopeptidase
MAFDVCSFVKNLEPIDLERKIPKSEYESRIKTLQGILNNRGFDVGIAFGNELRPGDTGWLTGYDPQIEPTAAVIGKKGLFVLGGPEGEAYAKETMMAGTFINVLEFKIPEEDYPGYEFMPLNKILFEAAGIEPKKIGILTLPSILPLEIFQLLKEIPNTEIIDASEILLDCRYQKSPQELEMMSIAARISTYAMKAMIAAIRPGLRELEVAACADYVMKAMGADRVGISTIVCSGWRAPNVIGRASNKIIEEGDMIDLTVSARYDGLASCMGRTVIAGKAHPDQLEFIDIAIKAYEKGIEAISYSKPASEVDRIVRSILDPQGLSPLYSLVHGIGWTEAMEGKGAATQHSTWNFPKGIAFMLDLGIFGRSFKSLDKNHMGLRIENPFIIDHEGNTKCLTVDLPLYCETGKIY